MKIRSGFISNSSSSSFVILGYKFESIESLLFAISINKDTMSAVCKLIYDNLCEYYDYAGEYTEDIASVVTLIKECDCEIDEIIDDINDNILKFKVCIVSRDDYGSGTCVYIGSSMNFIGNYSAVINRIEETKKEMEKLRYYDDKTLSIYAMFSGRDDEGHYEQI